MNTRNQNNTEQSEQKDSVMRLAESDILLMTIKIREDLEKERGANFG